MKMRFLHGTSSDSLEIIKRQGFKPPVYLTTDIDDAEYYAATGGEESLQKREEQYKSTTGVNARKHFSPDMWDMYQALYPTGAHPVVIELDLSEELVRNLKPDSGAAGGMVSDFAIQAANIIGIRRVSWPDEQTEKVEVATLEVQRSPRP
jgi:hypothetical protein